MNGDPESIGIAVAAMSLIGVIVTAAITGFVKLNEQTKTIGSKVQQIHIDTNSNLTGARRDLRLALIGVFLVIMASLAALVKGQIDGARREKMREHGGTW